jgi:imidazolonepropionase-like amidohydrolase
MSQQIQPISSGVSKRQWTVFVSVACCAWLAATAMTAVGQVAVVEGPASRGNRTFALVGGTIFPVSSEPIENGTIIVADGKILAIGQGIEIPADAEQFDARGKNIYPGLFEAHSQLGLTEIGQVPATIDTSETGELNPNVKSLVAVNPDSELIPVTRSNGVLLALTAPSGGLIAGQASVIQLDGWTHEDMCLKDGVSMQVVWPSSGGGRGRGRRGGGGDASNRYEEQIQALNDLFDETAAYDAGRQSHRETQPPDLRLEAMVPVVKGEMPMMVRADSLKQIQDAVSFAARHKARLIILGGFDAPRCSELLKQHNVPVIVSAVHRRPLRRNDDFDSAYNLPGELANLGILFCISCTDRSETWNTRILPDQAGMAVAYGLDPSEALKAVTLYPARILGVDDKVGSLEVGKHATFFVSDGDALETSSHVVAAWIQGRAVDLTNRQTRLYNKYRGKYDELNGDHIP